MIKEYTPSRKETVTQFDLVFYTEPGWGLSFPCDENGKVNLDDMQPAAVKNYQFAMANPQHYPHAWNKVEKRNHDYRIPASGVCHCGTRIELTDEYYAACQCPTCGQWWNLSGQELRPPCEWEEELEPD